MYLAMRTLTETTIYAQTPDGTVDELHLVVFDPINEENKCAIRVSVTRNQSDVLVDESVYGADRWQAIMIGIGFLRLRVSLILKKSYVTLYSTRECVDEGREITLQLIFPQY